MRLPLLYCLLGAVSGALPGQASAPIARHAVSGVVFDSVSHVPVVGAEVQIVLQDSRNIVIRTTTDSAGRFRVTGLPAGQYLVGFYHETLTAFGLDAPRRVADLSSDTLVTADLGIPSGSVVRSLRCRDTTASGTMGMLAGLVRGPVPPFGVAITVEWLALELGAGPMRTVRQRVSAAVGTDGAYQLCDLPGDAPLDLRVAVRGYRVVQGAVTVPGSGVARQDLTLVDTGVARGSARIRGRVVHNDGTAVATGRATIAALRRDVPVDEGAFTIGELPLGTWLVELRSVGLEPQSALLQAADGASPSPTFTLTDSAQPLGAVTVVERAGRNGAILDGVLRRSRSSFGTMFLPGSAALKNAVQVADVLRSARGFRSVSPTEVYGRPTPRKPCRRIAIYLDGVKQPLEPQHDPEIKLPPWADINAVVPITTVLAIEAYPDVAFAPVEWRTGDVCAVVAIWTKQ